MKNILHLSLSMGFGGLERIISTLIINLNRNRFQNYICCLDRGGVLLDEIKDAVEEIFILHRRPGVIDWKLLFCLFQIIKKHNIEIIHSHSGCSLYAAIAGRLGGAKVIVHTDHGRLVPDRFGLILEDKMASMLINKYVAVSQELSDYLQSKVKIHKDKLLTIINGIDTEVFKPLSYEEVSNVKRELDLAEDTEIVGTVCRLDPVKNLVCMIHTLKGIIKSRKNTMLLIIGEGQEKKNIEDTIEKSGLTEKIILLGERSDIARIMPIFNIFVLPSLSEGTSMTILEAMSCGIPVIASLVGGNSTLVKEGINGHLFPLDRPDILVERVVKLLNDKEKAKEMGKEARKIVESELHFTHMLKKYTDLYLN